ncbi:hypothetical protein D8M04_14705 [Oceanobacillus piezotolerans]|uniref:HTH domain-containing protein n=1 Tax=Oceanobacillus piezotolerans TaxID=2448030 RepID=A0A498DBF0_9BACI|nr:hypothetical protein [Oceanobacillus piezotolerans]RLL42797.1 hypothetical protein D8M04_14705 [Oceanobacillus piezotolerans]
MKVKIALFGRKETISRVESRAEMHSDIEIVPFIYENENEIVKLFEKAFMCDIYLFTDALSYLYVKEKIIRKRLPSVQVLFDERMVLSSFCYLLETIKRPIESLSIDIENKTHVHSVLQDLGKNSQNIYVYEYGNSTELDKIVEYHEKLWKEGKIEYVLTSVRSVEEKLKELDIPVQSMTIPTVNLDEALEEAKSSVKLNLSKSAQVVTGYIQIKNHEAILHENTSEYLQTQMSKLHHHLTTFSKKTDVTFHQINNHQFVLFGTIAMINHLTDHFRDFPLLREISAEIKHPINMGYGLGLTAKQSAINAQIALETCSKSEDSKCYIVNERQETIGPIGIKKEFDASKLYHALIHKARLNNELSYNFIDFIRTRNNEPFSSNDIAKYYNVTKRSAERTVNKLLTGDVIKVSGEERPYQKGRPRKLFTLNQ